nr:exodeoxyribonuclease V subunit gamma [Propionibacteriales bacterium]
DQLRGRPTRANFRTGHLTMCTMMPMRSVPHRVVCLLGIDDGVFPRGAHIDGDDILARRPLVGERDSRSEDRQLYLDAVLAAKERLVVVYSGADERTGAQRPPAVPLGELLDVLDRTAHTPAGRVRDRILVRHPLQPFDARNFTPGKLVSGSDSFSFDTSAYAGNRAVCADRQPRPPFLSSPLAAEQTQGVIALDALARFLEHPVKQFLRQRLGLSATEEGHKSEEAIPVDPDPLDKWAVGDRLLTAGLSGVTKDAAVRAEGLRGLLPPGALGTALIDPLVDDVTALLNYSAPLRVGNPEHHDVSIGLPSAVTLTGTVAAVYGDRVVRVVYSKLGPKHKLRAWVQLLALCAQTPDQAWEAVTAGRGKKGGVLASHLAGVSGADAVAHLNDLVEVYRAGMGIPLPLPPKAAAVYAAKRRDGVSVTVAETQAGKEWRTGSPMREIGEFDDADHQRVWEDVSLGTLLAVPADPSDTRWPDEPHRFGQLARAVWTPLLDAETAVSS